jgi:Tfp pilus assembly protein PilX
MTNQYSYTTSTSQRGTIALLMSLIILTLITFVSLYTAKTVSVEQKISGNEYRSRVAFEAAEAGMEAAMTYISRSYGGPDRDADGDLTNEKIFDSSGNVVVGIPTFTDEQDWRTYDNNSKTIVKLSGTSTSVNITALGISGDGSAQRTIHKSAAVVDPLPGFPNVPFSARGAVSVQGSATIHNPEGNSTVRTGGVFGWTSAGANTNLADPSHDNYPECLGGSNSCDISPYSGLEGCNSAPDTNFVKCGTIQASTAGNINIDIDQNFLGFKNATDEEFFINMFGVSKEHFKKKRVDRFVNPADVNELYTDGGLNQAHGEVIWVTGDIPDPPGIGGIVAGCYYTSGSGPNSKDDAFDENCEAAGGVLEPVIIIFDGDVSFKGNPIFFGMIYITGNITQVGNVEVQGALAQEQGPASVDVTGSLDIWYDSAILEMTSGNGPFSTASGTWKDF